VPETTLEPFGTLDLKDALVLLAFPTTGSAGSIAAHYLQRHLDLPLVGHFRIEGLNGVVAIQDGIATTPVRIFGGEVHCSLEEDRCPRLFLVTTELALPPDVVHDVAVALIQAAGDARLLLCLEGVVRQEGDETPDVFIAADGQSTLDMLARSTGLPVAGRALLVGMTAEMLLGSDGRTQAGAMIVEARADFPDGRAAAALVEALDKLIPDIRVDPKPLVEEALDLEKQILAAQQAAEPQLPRGHQSTFI